MSRMPARAVTFALLVISVTTLASCKDLIRKLTGKGGDEGDGGSEGSGGGGCELPKGVLKQSFTIKAGCKVEIDRELIIDDDGFLTVEAGATLRFKAGTGLVVRHGGLVARGTEKAPVVFTSANTAPAKGDWDGIRFEAKVSDNTELERVLIEYAGKAGGYDRGAITFWGDSPGGRVSITNSVIRQNGQRAIENMRPKATFAKFEGNTLEDNDGTSLLLHPNVVGSIGHNVLKEPIRVTQGQVNVTATWPKTEQPFFVEGELSIQGVGTAAVLTLPEGATLKFGAGVRMDIGEGAGGGLVAKRVTFTSADPSPTAGSWVGMLVYSKASSTKIDGAVIEYAGKTASYGRGAVTFWGTKAGDVGGFEMTNTTFRNNKGAAIYSRGGCGDLEAASAGNRSEDVPLCAAK